MKRFDLPDTVAGRRRMVERLDRRAVKEEIKTCGILIVAVDLDARCSHLRRGLCSLDKVNDFLNQYRLDADPTSLVRKDTLLNHLLCLHILHRKFIG